MFLPTHVAAGPATAIINDAAPSPSSASPGSGISPENWSSLIGIITAITGNILISFALNMQRYAHLRLEREWQDKERLRKKRIANYRRERMNTGEERIKTADGRRKWRDDMRETAGSGLSESERIAEGNVPGEQDPLLLPLSRNNTRTGSTSNLNSIQEEEEGGDVAYKQESYLRSPYWWAGIILMTTGEAGNFLAYGFAPASIVSPLGVVALISNCIIAPIMLKEPYRKRDGLGVLIAVGGAVTVVLSASDDNPKLGPDEIWDLISTWEFETYLGITVAIISALMVASNRFGEKSILIDLSLVGLFGGYTALSTKGVASMLSYTLWRAITFPVTYLLVAILVGTAIMQIKYVNRALQRFDATQVIPVQFVLFTLSVILGSAILYRDFERTSGEDAGEFVGGCAMTFLGVWLITSGRSRRGEDDEDRDPEPEDAIGLIDGERYHDDVDGVGEGMSASSRRSSMLRAMSPPMDIDRRVPTRELSQSNTPSITFTPDDSVPQTPTTPNAVPDISSPLTANPWEQDDGNSSPSIRPRPGNLSRHTSTPVLPSEATDPPRPSASSPELSMRPHTPMRNTSDTAAVAPNAPSALTPRLRRLGTAERVGARNSVSGPLLASPLSSTLSAMVADLKRGGSIRGHPAQREHGESRRRQSGLGVGANEAEEGTGEQLDRRRTATDEEMGRPSGRGRSLSGTLTDMWRGLRGQDDAESGDMTADEGR